MGKTQQILVILLFTFFSTKVVGQNSFEYYLSKSISYQYTNLDSAELLYDSALLLKPLLLSDTLQFKLLELGSIIDFRKGNYENSTQKDVKRLRIAEKMRDSVLIAKVYGDLATNYYYTSAIEKADESYKKALNIIVLFDPDNEYRATLCNNLGSFYNKMEQYDSARKYLNNAVWFSADSMIVKTMALNNLGELYSREGKNQKAIDCVKKSLLLSRSLNRFPGVVYSGGLLATVFSTLNQPDSVFKYLDLAEKALEKGANIVTKRDLAAISLRYHIQYSQPEEALHKLSYFESLVDSLTRLKTNQNIFEKIVEYQVEKKEAEKAKALAEKKQAQAESKTNKLYLIVAIIGILLLGVSFLWVQRSNQQKRRIGEMKLEIKENEMKELMALQEAEALSSMLKGQEEERERIAKDLHDQLGGTLAALKLSLRKNENKVAKEDLETVDQAVAEVRNIAHNLSNGLLEKQGLTAALNELKLNIERSGKLKFNLFLQGGFTNIKQETALELYRIIQELTNNTIKHANATEINLQSNENEVNFNLIYEDNGIGFNKEKVKEGMGTRNIQARLKKIKGSLHLDSQEGRGTIAIIEIEKS